ncbi:hypothetical protein I3843_14G110100 [Carya illinoinensis]|nr:hypothetical protein I3843_14G110100 [Carya illinoinensis]
MYRSSSSASSKSGMPPDIINEEDCEISENDSNSSDQWHMPKIKIDSLYHRTWIQSKMKSLFHVKTIKQTLPVSRTQEYCVLFQKKTIKSFQEKGYKFMHIASVQIAIVPLVRKGIDACVLLCLRDGRHKNFNNSVLGIVQTSLIDGPVHFNCYPDLTVDLFDKNVFSTLTLNVKTSGFDMVEGSKPISLVYRLYYKVLSTSLEPKAKIKSPKNETVLMYSSTLNSNITTPKMLFWKDVTLPDEWVLKQELPPREVPAQNSDLRWVQQYLDGTINIAFDQPSIKERRNSFAGSRSSFGSEQDLRDKNLERYLKDHDNPTRSIMIRELHPKEGKSIKEEVQVEDDAESTSPTASDMVAPVHSSLMVLDKALDDLDSELLVIDMVNLHADFMSKENHDKRKTYHRIYSISEKQNIRKEWKKKMYKDNKHILFFDFLENHYVSKKDDSKQYLNVLKSSFTKEEGRKVVKTSHPPLETILVSVKGKEVKASPFKISDPEQNNFVNQTLHTIGQQLDRIEDKVEKPVLEKLASTSLNMVEKPLIILPEDRSKIHFGKTKSDNEASDSLAKPSLSELSSLDFFNNWSKSFFFNWSKGDFFFEEEAESCESAEFFFFAEDDFFFCLMKNSLILKLKLDQLNLGSLDM